MNETLSQTMWLALFEFAERGRTTTTKRTHDALVKRGFIEHDAGGMWRLTAHGRKMLDRVVAFDVSP